MTYITYDHTDTKGKKIFLVNMCEELQKPYSDMVRKGVAKMLREGKNVLFLAPKKGFASGIICNDCGHIPHCKQCDVSIAVHKTATGQRFGLCHICKHHYAIGDDCKQCGSLETAQYGLGSQQVAERVEQEFGIAPLVLENTSVNSIKKVSGLMGSSALSTARVVVVTRVLAEPSRDWQADCVVVLSADTGLSVPDFQASWHTFTGLFDLFTNWNASVFLVQSYNVDHYAITNACSLDKQAMIDQEDEYRKQYHYPPHGEICLILYKNEIEERLHSTVNKLYQELLFLKEQYEMNDLALYTAPPMIYKMFGKYRYTIVLKWPQVRQFMDIAFSKLQMTKRGFKVDWEPQQLV